jgi:hypothetical protein
MGSTIKWVLALGVGVAAGWALRSLADTPEGAGVKLLEVGIKSKKRLSAWAAVERERLDDMLAEAQSNIARESAAAGTTAGMPGREGQSSRRREARTARRGSTPNKAAKSDATTFNS